MKRIVAGFAVLAVATGGLFAVGSPAHAASAFEVNETGVTLEKSATHNGAYYSASKSVVIDGTINGDLHCAGETVTINGAVNGDVLCAAQKITINGTVSQDARVAGQIVTINGTVQGAVSAFGQDVTLSRTGVVGKDLNGAVHTLSIDGNVEKDLTAAAGTLAVTGIVKGDAHVNVESITLASKPAVQGNLAYTGPKEYAFAEGSVAGKTRFTKSNEKTDTSAGTLVSFVFFFGVLFVILTVTLALLVPRLFERSYGVVRSQFLLTTVAGVAFTFALPVLILILFVTGIGVPIAIVLLLVDILIKIVSLPLAAYYLARFIFHTAVNNIVLIALVGSILVLIAVMIPILNILVIVAGATLGAGALVVMLLERYSRPVYTIKPVVVPKSKKS